MSYEAAGSFWDIFIPGASVTQEIVAAGRDVACSSRANEAQKSLDAEADRIRDAWPISRSTFNVNAMSNVIIATKQMLEVAESVVAKEISARTDPSLNQQLASVRLRIAGARKFADGVSSARRQGIAQISSADFRMWVIRSTYEAASAYYTVAYVACQQTWVKDAFGWLVSACETVKSAVVSMVNAVVDITKAVLELPGDVASFVETLVTVATVAAAGYVGYRVYNHVQKRKKVGSGS